jgi:hypothetical protein
VNRPLVLLIFFSFFFTGACQLSGVYEVSAADRCSSFKREVRTAANRYLGIDYPWWYNLGQLKQESGCREGITSFDGGRGLSQFMPATEQECEKVLGSLNMYHATDAIKAQAYYLSKLDKQNPDGSLWITYAFYNSGIGTMRAEAQRAGKWDYEAMKKVCKRKILTLKRGNKLDLCSVGYSYPASVWNFGQTYRTSEDRRRFWQ